MPRLAKSARPHKPKSSRKGSQSARRRPPRKLSAGESTTELVVSLLHREAESVELLQGILSKPGNDALRSGLLQCLRLHECCVLRLKPLQNAHRPTATDQTDPEMSPTSYEVMVVTDDDILPEDALVGSDDDIEITFDEPYGGGPAFRSAAGR